MDRHVVSSSNIRSVGYDKEKRVLEIEFKGGGRYRYSGVSGEVLEEMLNDKSVGSYFYRNIKDSYPCEKV